MAKKLVTTLLLTGTLAFMATAAQAQSSITHFGPKQDREDSKDDERSRHSRSSAIVGAWFGTTATGLKQLITFHADGTVLRSVPGEVSTAPTRPPHTPAHGVWRSLGRGRFGVTMWDIFYDVNTGQLLHFMRIRLELTLADDRDSASATALLEVIDPQGVVTSSRTGAATFVRIPFEPLP